MVDDWQNICCGVGPSALGKVNSSAMGGTTSQWNSFRREFGLHSGVKGDSEGISVRNAIRETLEESRSMFALLDASACKRILFHIGAGNVKR